MDKFGDYDVRRLVGEGGMGRVYEAEERLSKRRVALKVLRPELTRDEEGRRLFVSEMRILAHLEHPNIVRSLASTEADGQLALVLEFLEGRTLRAELTRRGRLPWDDVVGVGLAIAEALAVAHAQEPAVVHRDLKPENVMITSEPDAPIALKVMDFGVAKVLASAHATNTQSLGTLQYMSPEQVDAKPIDARSDLYALGLVLYECLAGVPPFRSASPRELLNLQCTGAPPAFAPEVRRGLPRGVEDLVFALLAKAPEARPASARIVIERLEAFRPAVAPSAAPKSEAPRTEEAPTDAPVSAHGTLPSRAGSVAPAAGRADTIALLEHPPMRREVPSGRALIAIGLISLASALTTYAIRAHGARAHVAAEGGPVTSSTVRSR